MKTSTRTLGIAIASLLIGLMAGCFGDNKVSFDTLETAKTTAKANATYNAKLFRTANVNIDGWDLVSNGDSSQTNACPQGDGWATVEFISPDQKIHRFAKCSTFSAATACWFDEDFKKKPFAGDDKNCQPTDKVPHPLPTIKQ